jgi:hypothetical protein
VQARPQRVGVNQAAGVMRVLPGGDMAESFRAWREENKTRSLTMQQVFEAGWIAGITWHTSIAPPPAAQPPAPPQESLMGDPTPPQPPAPAKEPLVLMVHDQATSQTRVLDDATRATVLAALRFYEENSLRYGATEGQLTAKQVKALVARLDPESPEAELPEEEIQL